MVKAELAILANYECVIFKFKNWKDWESFMDNNGYRHGTGYTNKVIRVWDGRRVVYSRDKELVFRRAADAGNWEVEDL